MEQILQQKKEHIEGEIQKTLDQFDAAEQLPPDPFFFTRLQARLEQQNQQRGILLVFLRPALLTALVALNLSTAVWYFSRSDQQDQASSQQQFIQILARDLALETDRSALFGTE